MENEKTYQKSFFDCFELFYGDIREYNILALLPGYYERNDSSLIYMVKELIKKSKSAKSGFYLTNFDELNKNLLELDYKKEKTCAAKIQTEALKKIYSPDREFHRKKVNLANFDNTSSPFDEVD